MADHFDKNYCDERHKFIDEKFTEGKEQFRELRGDNKKLLWSFIGGMAAIILSLLSVLYSHMALRSDLMLNSARQGGDHRHVVADGR